MPSRAVSPALAVFGASIALAVLAHLHAEYKGQARAALFTKTLASAGFVLLGHTVADPRDTFDRLILLGLVLAACGDVALALPGERNFRIGVGAFALGHLAYAAAVGALVPSSGVPLYALAACVPSAMAYAWLYPKLGAMRLLVALYVVIITVMLVAALSLHAALGQNALSFTLGALLFYASDLSVARDRFVKAAFVNRAWGIPAYYAGQVCIAFACVELTG